MANENVWANMPDAEVLRYWREDQSTDVSANHGSWAYNTSPAESEPYT